MSSVPSGANAMEPSEALSSVRPFSIDRHAPFSERLPGIPVLELVHEDVARLLGTRARRQAEKGVAVEVDEEEIRIRRAEPDVEATVRGGVVVPEPRRPAPMPGDLGRDPDRRHEAHGVGGLESRVGGERQGDPALPGVVEAARAAVYAVELTGADHVVV